jgi:hypothetical protein
MKYNDVNAELLNRTNLVEDPDFIDDASTFLYERNGEVYADPEEIYEKFMEHMRISDTNEVTTLKDLVFVRDAGDELKQKTARLYHTYDKMNLFREDESLMDYVNTFGDYAEGVLTAPSTLAGILTGGLAKGTSIAGQQVAKAAVRKQLMSSITKRGALYGMATEGTIGVGQGALREGVRSELDPERDFSVENVALQGAISAVPGGVFGALGGRKAAKQGIKAERISQIGQQRVAKRTAAAREAARQTIQNASDVKKRQISQILVGAGDDIRGEKLPNSEYLLSQLDDDVQVRLQAAVLEVVEDIKPIRYADGTEERITETVARGLSDGTVSAVAFNDVLEKYSITAPQLALVFTADVSRAARTLQKASQVSRVQKMAQAIARTSEGGVDEGDLARAVRGGFSEADIEQVTAYHKMVGAFKEGAMGFEQLRRGLMTTQLQTTQRNIAGGGMRVFLDEVENIFAAGSRQLLGIKADDTVPDKLTPPSMIKYMFNQSEADVIAKSFADAMPQEARRLFAEFVDAADVTGLSGVGGALARIGRKANFLNMHADNFYKRAIFAGQLDRLTRSKFGKSVTDLMLEGRMDRITVDMYRNATNKAYELLYQKTPSTKTAMGQIANAYLKFDKQAGIGMLTGLVMPFPRFIMNQLQFMTERAPFIGLAFGNTGKIDKGVKFLTGFGMIGSFALYRATQGPDTEWYNHTNEKGQTTNLAPMLAGLTPFLYMGDVLYRAMLGFPLPEGSKMIDDLKSVAVGEGFRIGADKTLFDRIIPETFRSVVNGEDITTATSENLGKILGDYVATFAYNLPTGLARDGWGLLDDESRMVIETNGEVRMWDAFLMRATRGLPAPVRDMAISYYNPDIPIQARPVAEKSEDTKVQVPLSTSISGLNLQAPKSSLEKELTRLGMTTYDIYKPHPFGPADVIMRQNLGDKLNKKAVSIMKNEEYKRLTDYGKREMLKEFLKPVVSEERNAVYDILRTRVRSGEEKRFTEDELEKFLFETTGNKNKRKQAVADYKKRRNLPDSYVLKDEDYQELNQVLKAVMKSKRVKKKYAEGGFVSDEATDALMLSETASEQDKDKMAEDGRRFLQEMISFGLDSAPVIGEVRSAMGAKEAFDEGDYLGAGLGALGALPLVGAPIRKAKKVIDAADRFETKKIQDTVSKTKARKEKNDELIRLSEKNELPEEFLGFRVNDEVDIPGVGSGRIGRVYYNKEGDAMINVATELEDTTIVGMRVSEAAEKGVIKTKEAPVIKTKVNQAKSPEHEFVLQRGNRGLQEIRKTDPEAYETISKLSDDERAEFFFESYRNAWLERTGKKPNTDVTERNEIMENAARQVKDGNLSVEEFRRIADQHKPVKVWDDVPEMATYEDMFFALDARKRKSPFVGYNARIPEGTRMTSRLDIPAYTSSDTWVVTLMGKEKGDKSMYAPAVRLKNVDLNQPLKNQEKALKVASGGGKGPFAVMEGDYIEETAEDTYNLAKEAIKSDEWIQVGYDPTRRGFFYDRETMEPVLSADEIVQVGALVLAKKAVKGDPKDFKFARGGLMSRP